MNKILRGATSTHTFSHPYEADEIGKVRVIYKQGGKRILVKLWKAGVENRLVTVEDGKVTVILTIVDSLRFINNGTVKIQIQIYDKDGNVIKSDVMTRVTDEFIGG